MPEIGEIKRAREIGRRGANGDQKCIWHACVKCGKQRWVQFKGVRGGHGHPQSILCRLCSVTHSNGPGWKGGRQKSLRGYISICLEPNDFFFSMTSGHRVFEHRLVVAKALGRCLQSWEIVHHKEGFAKDDNRYPETLQLVTDDRHKQITILENRIHRLERRVLELEAEIVLLKMERKRCDAQR